MAHIIVVGNEKGGAGKSTVTMHVATSLARMDYRVGAIDLDLRQQTFGRYCANRQNHKVICFYLGDWMVLHDCAFVISLQYFNTVQCDRNLW